MSGWARLGVALVLIGAVVIFIRVQGTLNGLDQSDVIRSVIDVQIAKCQLDSKATENQHRFAHAGKRAFELISREQELAARVRLSVSGSPSPLEQRLIALRRRVGHQVGFLSASIVNDPVQPCAALRDSLTQALSN